MSNQPRPVLLNFITGNANKLKEVRAILSDVPGVELQSRNVEVAEIQGTIEEVAKDKCARAARAVSGLSLFRVGWWSVPGLYGNVDYGDWWVDAQVEAVV